MQGTLFVGFSHLQLFEESTITNVLSFLKTKKLRLGEANKLHETAQFECKWIGAQLELLMTSHFAVLWGKRGLNQH